MSPDRRSVALYGGSFSPPHVCHVMTCAYVLSATRCDEVWLVPVGRHAFAKGRNLAPFEHRRRMCELSLSPFGSQASVCDIEHRLPGKSRTIDTVEALQREHPDVDFSVVLGTDLLAETHKWKDFDRLADLVPFIIIGREGSPSPPGVTASPQLPDVSSTDVRRRLATGEPTDGLLPTPVRSYIEEHGLFREEHA